MHTMHIKRLVPYFYCCKNVICIALSLMYSYLYFYNHQSCRLSVYVQFSETAYVETKSKMRAKANILRKNKYTGEKK